MNKSVACFSILTFFGIVAPAIADVRVASMGELRDLPDGRMLTETSPFLPAFKARITKTNGQLRISISEQGEYALFCGEWYEAYPTGSAWRPKPGMFVIDGAPYRVREDGQKALAFPVHGRMTVTGVCQQNSEVLLFKLK